MAFRSSKIGEQSMTTSNHCFASQIYRSGCGTAAASYVANPALRLRSANRPLAVAAESTRTQLPWRDQGVLNLTNSPYAKLHNVPVRAVTIEEGFWSKRRKTNVESSIPTMREQLEQHGRMDNFRRLVGKSRARKRGRIIPTPISTSGRKRLDSPCSPAICPDLRNVTAA